MQSETNHRCVTQNIDSIHIAFLVQTRVREKIDGSFHVLAQFTVQRSACWSVVADGPFGRATTKSGLSPLVRTRSRIWAYRWRLHILVFSARLLHDNQFTTKTNISQIDDSFPDIWCSQRVCVCVCSTRVLRPARRSKKTRPSGVKKTPISKASPVLCEQNWTTGTTSELSHTNKKAVTVTVIKYK